MGCDKALLPHCEGGTWLERTLGLLAELMQPITLFSRHPRHLQLAGELAKKLNPELLDAAAITIITEPPPWEGPLLALHRLMQLYPDQRILLCPVDMPALNLKTLQDLMRAAEPERIYLAHDGQQLQPLLGLYPSHTGLRLQLANTINRGERSLQRWLKLQPCCSVALDPMALLNVNRPEELANQPCSCTSASHAHGPSSTHGNST